MSHVFLFLSLPDLNKKMKKKTCYPVFRRCSLSIFSLQCPCFTPPESRHPSPIYHWGNNYRPPPDWWLLPHWQAVSQTAGLPELKPLPDKWVASINHHGTGGGKCNGKMIIKGISLLFFFFPFSHLGAVSRRPHASSCTHMCARTCEQ